MKLLIVIVNYKVPGLVVECLKSLEGELPEGTKVGLVENGSGDDSAARLAGAIEENEWGPWVDFKPLAVNLGFTGGNNSAIREAMGGERPPQYVMLLNPDTVVLKDGIAALVEFMDSNPRVGIAGSRLQTPDGIVQASPFRFQGIATELDRGLRLGVVSKLMSRWAVVPPTPQEACEVEWVSGASMIIRREVIEDIGMLDEGYFTYFDDIDYCLSARKAGWSTWFVPASRIVHLEGQSTGINQQVKRRAKYWFQARRRFFLKHYGPVYAAAADAAFIFGLSVWRVRRFIQNKPEQDPPYLLRDSIRNSVFATGFEMKDVENPSMGRPVQAEACTTRGRAA